MNSSLKFLAWEIVYSINISKIVKQCITSLRVGNSSYHYSVILETCISNKSHGTTVVPFLQGHPFCNEKVAI
jgi:hypothetical protein